MIGNTTFRKKSRRADHSKSRTNKTVRLVFSFVRFVRVLTHGYRFREHERERVSLVSCVRVDVFSYVRVCLRRTEHNPECR